MRTSNRDVAARKAATERGDAVIRRALRELEARARKPGALLSSSSVVADWFRLKLAEYEHEVFAAAWLDNRHRLIAFEELFRGTLGAAAVPAREIVKAALRHNAPTVLFAHNHPSGNSTPSSTDLTLTLEFGRALDLVDVRVLDHFVVTAREPPQSVWPGALMTINRSKARARKSPADSARARPRATAVASRAPCRKNCRVR